MVIHKTGTEKRKLMNGDERKEIFHGICSGDIDISSLNTYTMLILENISKISNDELRYYTEYTKRDLNFIPKQIKCIIILYFLSKEYETKNDGAENSKYSDCLRFFIDLLNEYGGAGPFFEILAQLCEEHQNRQIESHTLLKRLDEFIAEREKNICE